MKNRFVNPSLLSMNKSQDRGANAEDLFNQNRRLVLKLIADSSGISRKELSSATGLKPATISLVMTQLLEMGIVEESGFIEGDSGRKVMGFRLSGGKHCTAAVRMSPSYLKIASYDLHNNNLYIKKMFIESFRDMAHTCDVIADEVNLIKPHVDDRKIIGVGLGIEGPFFLHNGFYKMEDPQKKGVYFDIGKCLNRKLELPILVNRQTNFAVYDLWKKESSKNQTGCYVFISISYTIECGIMVNGEIINGANGTAGLIGECVIAKENGKPLFLRDVASTDFVLKSVRNLITEYPDSILKEKIDDLNIRDVVRAYFLNDELAVRIFNSVGEYTGQIIANIVSLLNPDYIFVGDEIPTTVSIKAVIEDSAKKYLRDGISPNIHTYIFEYKESRFAEKDPALVGASSFIIDAFIQTLEFS